MSHRPLWQRFPPVTLNVDLWPWLQRSLHSSYCSDTHTQPTDCFAGPLNWSANVRGIKRVFLGETAMNIVAVDMIPTGLSVSCVAALTEIDNDRNATPVRGLYKMLRSVRQFDRPSVCLSHGPTPKRCIFMCINPTIYALKTNHSPVSLHKTPFP